MALLFAAGGWPFRSTAGGRSFPRECRRRLARCFQRRHAGASLTLMGRTASLDDCHGGRASTSACRARAGRVQGRVNLPAIASSPLPARHHRSEPGDRGQVRVRSPSAAQFRRCHCGPMVKGAKVAAANKEGGAVEDVLLSCGREEEEGRDERGICSRARRQGRRRKGRRGPQGGAPTLPRRAGRDSLAGAPHLEWGQDDHCKGA